MGNCKNNNCNNGIASLCQLFVVFLFLLFFIGIVVYLYNQYTATQQTTAMLQAAALRSASMPSPTLMATNNGHGAPVLAAAAAAAPPAAPSLCGKAVSQGGPFGSCIICGCDVRDKFVSCCGHLGRGTTYYGHYCVPENCGVAA